MRLTTKPNITVDRWYRYDCTIGYLSIDGFKCFSLELPDLGNEKDISCIPEGDYEYYYRVSPSNGPCLELKDVPNRRYIQTHAGNFTKQTAGCLLVGDAIRFIDNDNIPDISNSKSTLAQLLSNAGINGIIRIKS
jgi:hypothetical protein